jgi:hypothetical protein
MHHGRQFPRRLLDALEAAGLRVGDVLTPEAIDRLATALAEAEARADITVPKVTGPPERHQPVTDWPGPFVVSD